MRWLSRIHDEFLRLQFGKCVVTCVRVKRTGFMFSMNRSLRHLVKLLLAIVFAVIADSAFADPATDVLRETGARVQPITAAQDEVTPSLMERPEVLGTAVGLDETGNPVLKVYVDRDAVNVDQAVRTLPREVRGMPLQGRNDGCDSRDGIYGETNTTHFAGMFGGSTYDLANGYCCGGTLGALVRIRTTQYILSAGPYP